MMQTLSPPGDVRLARGIAAALEAFEPITLDDLKNSDANLLDRTETKFLMTADRFVQILSDLGDAYRVLTIEGARQGRYETEYYDTDSFLTYLQHHNGRATRYKLRFRHYLSSDTTFLEVKEKRNTGRTVKKRLETDGLPELSDPGPGTFLAESFPYDAGAFHPVLLTAYDRITLVARDHAERLTFDLNLTFDNGMERRSYPRVVIGEIKHDRALRRSPAMTALGRAGVRKTGFSKYCIGVSLLYTGLKHNRFKRNLLFLEKLSSEGRSVC
ncbi:MAG TPA: polyphosphate polymerase domain-containing protein [Methanofollis liminatans]|uniref:Polyphosphate polymerase domain-containing protein n=1 Tax=Methanofollis liminatans TaxID=2201 RepID=A0A831PLK2_9EURY|nr:polyphosphate polymerase domain-containing protein [Methanofollis liminatans]